MYFSNKVEEVTIYKRDDDGNIIYVEIDGEQVPVEAGTKSNVYSEPIEFHASISGKLNELHMKSFGIDMSAAYSEIVVEKDLLPSEFGIGSIIWKNSPIVYEEDGTPKGSSSDYTVMGILDEGLQFDWYLLKRNNVDAD